MKTTVTGTSSVSTLIDPENSPPPSSSLRASEMVGEADAEMEKALTLLSEELSIALYSREGQRPFPKAEAELIRNRFRKALRHARAEHLKACICSVVKR